MRDRPTFRRDRTRLRGDPRRRANIAQHDLYAGWDLLIRLLSATGVLIIGVAGWMLQRQVETSRQARVSAEDGARVHIAEARSLVDLELLLRDVAEISPNADKAFVQRRANELDFIARGLEFENRAVDIHQVSVPSLAVFFNGENRRMPVRKAAIILSELMMIASESGSASQVEQNVRIDSLERALVLHAGARRVRVRISAETRPEWNRWIVNTGATKAEPWRSYRSAATDLAEDVALLISYHLMQHPEIADRYADVRNQAAETHSIRRAEELHRLPRR